MPYISNHYNYITADFDELKEELGPSRDASLRRDMSLDVQYDEQDMMKVNFMSAK